jgi:hypothetical protein
MKRIAFPYLVAFAIVACHTDRPLPPGIAAEIVDGNDASGNPFFWWLPPMVQQHAPASQVFSGKLKPTVTIADCDGSPLTTFTGSDIQASAAEFHVNWHTNDFDLTVGCEYRIAVLIGTRELGHADVAVVGSGKDFKNASNNDDVPLLADRTLPIKFFIGVGSLCTEEAFDCGEGTARGGENTVIVTRSGRAGVFIPAAAVDAGKEVTITIESVDDRSPSNCIPDLAHQFPGAPDEDPACYDYFTTPPISDVNDKGSFNGFVTVGICPPNDAITLDDETLDLLQIFQFDPGDDGVPAVTKALPNVEAPFLMCDPHYSPSFGSRKSLFGDLARAFASLISPRPLYASSRSMMFDLGAGGSTDGFSRFTWALPIVEEIR